MDAPLAVATSVKEIGVIESAPVLDGRNMVMLLGPTKQAGQQPVGATGSQPVPPETPGPVAESSDDPVEAVGS